MVKNCKIWTYSSGLNGRKEMLQILKKSIFKEKVALALHSAADVYGYKNNNLETLELYLLDPFVKKEIKQELNLRPQERGYEVILIEPYYKAILNSSLQVKNKINTAHFLLTYLDLFNFPLRGHEQAEFMELKIQELKQLKGKNG